MRLVTITLGLIAILSPGVLAGDLRHFEDAPLHALTFVDGREGWAVGDEGVIWHTIDGGKTWERQPTGVRASLRGVQFLNPYTGWVVGREELPGGESTGVLLFTRDGGLKWQRVALHSFPGLNRLRFLDAKTGFLVGDGCDQYPSGVFVTHDGGRTWAPLAGPRTTSWLAADFSDADNGALGGAWNRLAVVRRDTVVAADLDTLGGRSLRGLSLSGKVGWAVGQGGILLYNKDTSRPASDWSYGSPADLGLPTEVRAGWDFHAVHCREQHIWAAGRPGSVLLHSANGGASWQMVRTRQPLPLNGIFFLDDQRGWAVGELGAILATSDGGRTWTVQRRGGERAALMFVHAHREGLPLETVAGLGGEEGYLTAVLKVVGSDTGSAAVALATEPFRLAAAMRQAGGAAAEALWQFPLPQHLRHQDRSELLQNWNRRHAGRSADELLRQLVLALRIWRPEVVVTDDQTVRTGSAAETVVAEALRSAFKLAADPKVFPEQIEQFGLQPWSAGKLYARAPQKEKSQVVYNASEPVARLQASPRDFAAPAAHLLFQTTTSLPPQRFFLLLESRIQDAPRHHHLMEGIQLARGGEARRDLGMVAELSPEVAKTLLTRRNLQALVEQPPGGLADPNRLLAQVGPALQGMPEDQGAPAALAVAQNYAQLGQWGLAREVFLLMLDRFPGHPLSLEACRWLIGHSASSEARRRQELGQFLTMGNLDVQASIQETEDKMPHADGRIPLKPGTRPTGPIRFETKVPQTKVEVVGTAERGVMQDRIERRRWYENGLALEPRLASFGPLFANEPATQFGLQSIRRNLGDFGTASKWYAQFSSRQPPGPWRDAALAELWLIQRSGPPPKAVVFCRQTNTRPYLDGQVEDSCWQGIKPLVLRSAADRNPFPSGETGEGNPGRRPVARDDTAADFPTEVFLTYDREYLYLALRCRHPVDRYLPPVKVRSRDADVRAFDRVSLLLDLDRDYGSYFHFQVDQRGCVFEDCCQGNTRDRTWNPRWFVACHSQKEAWQIEAAIPLAELTGDPVTIGKAWACNLVRIIPGRGVQAFSLPADAEPRPEGMGLLLFGPEERAPAGESLPVMSRAP